MGEYFRDNGGYALMIMTMTTRGGYRQMSLLLCRPRAKLPAVSELHSPIFLLERRLNC